MQVLRHRLDVAYSRVWSRLWLASQSSCRSWFSLFTPALAPQRSPGASGEKRLCLISLSVGLPFCGTAELCLYLVFTLSDFIPWLSNFSQRISFSLKDMTALRFRTIIKIVIPIDQQFVQHSVHWTGGKSTNL